ncbi:MAG: hypothetical protein HYX96_05280 [Chloroflexi bacterium]|nr:hypothetical protein [Chloroflexota bacterium]
MPDKSVARKLGIKEGYQVLIVNEPAGYRTILGELPPNVTVSTEPGPTVDLIQVFVTSRNELEHELGRMKTLLRARGLLWVSYPKDASRIKADINRDSINDYAHSMGLEGIAMISVDDTWSALRLKVI